MATSQLTASDRLGASDAERVTVWMSVQLRTTLQSVNCKSQHLAVFKDCTKYQEMSKALKISVVEKVSYRDALVKVKSGVLQRTTDRV